MELTNCVRCKRLFQKFKEPICEECKKADDKLFDSVKEFLDNNPSSTIMQIGEATGASHKRIMQWLREGRLELVEGDGELTCRHCGTSIASGVLCDECHMEVSRQVGDLFPAKPKPEPAPEKASRKSAVMHTRNKR